MERSLSALLPIQNVESTLARMVGEYLDVLPELTRDFQVVVADDGSHDATIEVADELATHYPQVTVVRHASPRGRVAALGTALGRSTGEILLVRDEECDLSMDEVHRLWRAMDEHEIVLGRLGPSPDRHWPASPAPNAGGVQMLSRRAIASLIGSLTDQTTLRSALWERGYTWHEMELADRTASRALRRDSGLPRRFLPPKTGRADRSTRTDPPSSHQVGPKWPEYLTALRDFALGE
ncbi:MAG: glycosyltransferase [Planctomycetota bacterium]